MVVLNLLQTPWSTFAAVGILVVAVVFYRLSKVSRESLDHIQVHEFADGDSSTERYIRDSKALLHDGYEKVSFPSMVLHHVDHLVQRPNSCF